MTVNVGHLYRKKIVRNTRGDIIDWQDEADGGWIIRKGQIVNQAKIDEYIKKEEDRKRAGRAEAEAIAAPPEVVAQRTGESAPGPNKVDALEKKVEGMESNIKEILKLLQK